MYACGLAIIMLVAGCDAVFGLDKVHARADATGNAPSDAPVDSDGASPTPDAPDPRIVARFDFEGTFVEGKSGTAATCISGTGCPTFTTGEHGMGIQLDGTNDCLQFNLPANPTKFTVAFWLNKPNDLGASVVAKPVGPGGSNTFQVDVETNRTIRFITYNGSANQILVNNQALAVGVWTHIAVSFDGTKRLYVDGNLAPSTMPGDPTASDGLPFLIGCDRDSGTYVRFLGGMLDDVVMYDVALSPAEIAALAQP